MLAQLVKIKGLQQTNGSQPFMVCSRSLIKTLNISGPLLNNKTFLLSTKGNRFIYQKHNRFFAKIATLQKRHFVFFDISS